MTTTYRGDAELARLLRENKAELDVAGARDLVAGVLAAPKGWDPEAWLRLVVPEPTAALMEQLLALGTLLATERRDGGDTAGRLAAQRAELARRGLAGFLVPLADEHQGEYVPARARRLAWLTGFTGSFGLAIVLGDKAAIFVDGRYTLQAEQQVDGKLFERHHITQSPPEAWLEKHLGLGEALGFDPWLHTKCDVERLERACAKAGGRLAPATPSPIDAVWTDQPPPPIAPVVPHDVGYAGRDAKDKRAEIASAIAREGAGAAVLSDPASIAWLLNVRGGDVPNTPLPLGFAIIHADARVELYLDPRKAAPELRQHLGPDVVIRPPADA
ncbi:MAG: aminopeptidase P family N-terminal domain-containing protein, partial [Alphaproteobacteria bacterium]